MSWDILLVIFLGSLAAFYVVVRIGSYAYFQAKLNYQRTLINNLTGGECNGKSPKESE